ncbi:hypothetical protein FHEFKHOI_00318 [Candidatus Methanoperedenaceae archaeon GB50]|nr:hypothetical protein AIOGIFDO_00315 [Candidatus Methanoperedenaceae archaeon GB37]CAD7768548.1 hypothetical protein FHEFKHOI_00318 [Candidatus Methanoperedenaceae archaeon GB50]CAD7779243.1 MAG: hypothetical protein KBONHNOK_01282 [Candidatus Methanoperedenaceae archaeon GB50]
MGQVLIEISLQITADKKLRYAPPKLPSATSFIRDTLGDILLGDCHRKRLFKEEILL